MSCSISRHTWFKCGLNSVLKCTDVVYGFDWADEPGLRPPAAALRRLASNSRSTLRPPLVLTGIPAAGTSKRNQIDGGLQQVAPAGGFLPGGQRGSVSGLLMASDTSSRRRYCQTCQGESRGRRCHLHSISSSFSSCFPPLLHFSPPSLLLPAPPLLSSNRLLHPHLLYGSPAAGGG